MSHTAVSSLLFFDKMTLEICVIGLIIAPFCLGQPTECVQKNISCADVRIQVPDGFSFPHECSEATELSIEANKTVIATALLHLQSFNYSAEVLRMDKYSFITKHCQDLKVTCIIPDGDKHIKDKCLDIKNTSEPESPDPTDPLKPWGYICIGVGVIILIAFGFWICCCGYKSWKKKVGRQQGVTTPGFSQYLLTCFGLRKRTFLEERGEGDIGLHETVELQEVTAGDLKTQQNGDVRNVTPHESDPRGSGENEAGEENLLRNGHVHSDDVSAPKVNGESHHRALNRNRRDDHPGGVKSNERKDTIGKMASGLAIGDHSAEDHETEGRPLLPIQRPGIQQFDVTGEATALVNKPGFDPDQVSGCSDAPETDVESAHNMKN